MDYSPAEIDEVREDWIRLLTLVLGWPRDMAMAWARDHVDMMENPFFSHENISWPVVPLFITDDVRRQTKAIGELHASLDLALERFRRDTSAVVNAERVEAIRKEIRDIIEAFAISPQT